MRVLAVRGCLLISLLPLCRRKKGVRKEGEKKRREGEGIYALEWALGSLYSRGEGMKGKKGKKRKKGTGRGEGRRTGLTKVDRYDFFSGEGGEKRGRGKVRKGKKKEGKKGGAVAEREDCCSSRVSIHPPEEGKGGGKGREERKGRGRRGRKRF